MHDDPLLDDVQKELLAKIIEAERSVADDKRGKFLATGHLGSPLTLFIHSGGAPQVEGHLQDAEILASRGLLHQSYGSKGSPQFWVTPEGNLYYENLRHSDAPAETVEDHMRGHLSSQEFRKGYPDAFQKWSNAEKRLWSSDSLEHLSLIGHLCREAMQSFADRFVSLHGPEKLDARQADTVKKIRAVLDGFGTELGKTEKAFLDALLAYWGCVSDLVQRQEHGAEREKESLNWEDARRVVFQTLVVMYELDRASPQ